MKKLKSIKLYFFSILRLIFLSFRNFYFKSNFYNKKLITFVPDKIFYNPSTHLSASLTTISNDFYKITDTAPELLWKINTKDKQKLEKFNRDIEKVRRNKKIHFWMKSGTMKLSTIHSFKGWEARNVIIVTPEKKLIDSNLYAALTRVRENLIVINQNKRYAKFGYENFEALN